MAPIFTLALCAAALARAGPLRLTDGGASLVLPPEKPLLIVTHGAPGFDYQSAAKPGINAAVKIFKSNGWPVVYLNICGDVHVKAFSHYMDDSLPAADICSGLGEHRLRITSRDIFVAGGNWDACLERASSLAVKYAFAHQRAAAKERYPFVTLHVLADGVYHARAWGYSVLPLMEEEGRRRYMKDRVVQIAGNAGPPLKTRVYWEGSDEGLAPGSSDRPAGELIVHMTRSGTMAASPMDYRAFDEREPLAPAKVELRRWARALRPGALDRE